VDIPDITSIRNSRYLPNIWHNPSDLHDLLNRNPGLSRYENSGPALGPHRGVQPLTFRRGSVTGHRAEQANNDPLK
jgi:hypothetical protein